MNCALGFDTKPILLASYVTHGARRATANQFERPAKGAGVLMALLILGEMAASRWLSPGSSSGNWCEPDNGPGNSAAADRLLQGPEPPRPEAGDGLSQCRRHYRGP
ncbi:hypothetical protein HKBS1_4085 [Mycobacterium tuberculosis HKBS1]|nr:hypothetical protein HKBS1_4085 [Mycobacterium tuberculosis HKBS1]